MMVTIVTIGLVMLILLDYIILPSCALSPGLKKRTIKKVLTTTKTYFAFFGWENFRNWRLRNIKIKTKITHKHRGQQDKVAVPAALEILVQGTMNI